jgi:hypothetical protein
MSVNAVYYRNHKKLLDWATEDASSSDAAKSPQRKVGGERSETIIPLRRYSPFPERENS